TSAISIYFYIGNKKPKAASIMMIITGVVVGLGTALTGFLPALLFLIAGIVGLVRKPPKDPIAIEACVKFYVKDPTYLTKIALLKYKKGVQKTSWVPFYAKILYNWYAPGRIRTPGAWYLKPLLYPTELRAQ